MTAVATLRIERYSPADIGAWDEFVRSSKNGTFLFQRGYMDYHADRFHDHSLLVRDTDGDLLALLPGHAVASGYFSHGGLTYGGFITDRGMKAPLMLEVFEAVSEYLTSQGFQSWSYKTIPSIFHHYPAEEDRYALFLGGAVLTRRDVLAVVDKFSPLPYQERRMRAVKKAQKEGHTLSEDTDFAGFWEMMTANLQERHGVAPVHKLEEIRLLQSRFPERIRLFTCRNACRLLGGVILYDSDAVSHVQYIASTEEGRKRGALDGLFHELLTRPDRKRFFDFGISNEQGGRKLNRGLIDQKEGFGARTIVHDHYSIDLTSWLVGQYREALA